MSRKSSRTLLKDEISFAKKSLASRPDWMKSIDRFEGRNLPSVTYGEKAHPPISPKKSK